MISGEVRQIQHADYVLSAVERQQGYTLLCTHTAVTDLVVETLEARGSSDIPDQAAMATVRAGADLGRDARLLHLQTPRSNRLRFLAGQSVALGVADPGGDLAQTLPLAGCPCDERDLHFHVMRDEAPLAQRLFAGALRPGTTVSVRGPAGDFVLDPESTRPLLLACDLGFGPIKSAVEHAIASEQVDAFALNWVARSADGHYLGNQCRAWAAAFDGFSYVPLVDADAAAGARRAVERLAADGLAPQRCDVFVTRPEPFMQAAVPAQTRSLIL